MKYYRFYIEKTFKNSIYESEKAIGFDLSDNCYISHTNHKIAWFAKSQIIIEETEEQIDYYIPEWMLKKNRLTYRSFEGIGRYFRESDYLVER